MGSEIIGHNRVTSLRGGVLRVAPLPVSFGHVTTFIMSLYRIRLQYGLLQEAETPEKALRAVADIIRQNPFSVLYGVEEGNIDVTKR